MAGRNRARPPKRAPNTSGVPSNLVSGGAGKHSLAPDAGCGRESASNRQKPFGRPPALSRGLRCAALRCQQPALIGPHTRPVMPDDRCARFAHRQHCANSHRRNDLFEDHSLDFAVGSRTAGRYRGHPQRHDVLCFQCEQGRLRQRTYPRADLNLPPRLC